jgi:2-methylcitrate dehydratase PrpD
MPPAFYKSVAYLIPVIMSQELSDRDQTIEGELAEFVVELTHDEVPDDALRTAERCYVDTLGVMLAGSIERPGDIAARMIDISGSAGGEATMIGRGTTGSVGDVAFVNGTAGHALDFDDVSNDIGHPSVAIIPSALAVSEVFGTTGRDLVTAYVAGFEVANYIAATLSPSHYEEGWHSTSTFGTFSAAAAAAKVMGLDAKQVRHGLNIAASSSAGLQRNFGTPTKPMHAGQAARAGASAALLASEGFTADATAVSGDGGFLDLYSGEAGIDYDAAPTLGEEWGLQDPGVQIKKYPCCYCTHPGIAVASELANEHDIEASAVESVSVTSSEKGPQILQHDDPSTGFEAKFSMPYTVSWAIARDRVGLEAFDDENIDSSDVQHVRERLTYEADSSIPFDNYETRVVIETTDGNRYEGTKMNPPGRDGVPLSDEELEQKFIMCATRTLDETTARDIFDRLDNFREQDTADLRSLIELFDS